MKFPAVRIRFHDDTYENLVYAQTLVQAESWALELNERLLQFPPPSEPNADSSENESRAGARYMVVEVDR